MKIFNCRLCKGNLSESKLDLGLTPLANEFLKNREKQDLFPLQICKCIDCGHFQLNESVDENRLFKHYSFVSGTSPVNVEHFRQYAIEIIEKLNLKKGDKVLEIASNDGTLLKHFKDFGMQVLGIDPAENITTIANENGIETISDFFTEDTANQILEKYGKFDSICANNCFAHVNDLIDFTKGVKLLLSENGTFSFEVSYFLDVCNKTLFDTAYHEHKDYHLVGPLLKFFRKMNLMIYDVKRIDTHGGSIRVFVRHDKTGILGNEYYNYVSFLSDESRIDDKLEMLKLKIKLLGYKLREKLEYYKSQDKSIAIFGTPAKATTLMYALNIDKDIIDFAVDDAPLKQGTFTPGKHIPVLHPNEIYKHQPDVLLILAWNFSDSIIENCKKNGYKGKFIIPLPVLKVIE